MYLENRSHYYNGHYLSNNISESLALVQNQNYSDIECNDPDAADYLYDDACIFLHGSCQLFALALHKKFEYEVYELTDERGILEHVFCISVHNGRRIYIDIRGITTDAYVFFSEFQRPPIPPYQIIQHNVAQDEKLEDEGDETGFRFAKSIIEEYYQYYDANCISQ